MALTELRRYTLSLRPPSVALLDECIESFNDVSSVDDDLTEWCDNNGLQLWSKQHEIIETVNANRFTSIRSCNSSGKTQLMAALGLHYALTHRHLDSIVVVLSSGWENIRTGVHRRMGEIISDWDLPQKLLDRRYVVDGKELITFRSPPKGQIISKKLLQGIHARYILVLIDEGNEIPAPLWTEAVSVATGKHAKIVSPGNPTSAGTPFEKTFEPDSGWANVHISWDHMPAVTGEVVSEAAAESLLDEETVKEIMRNSAEYEIAARVHGEFPTESQLAFFRLDRIDEAIELELEVDDEQRPLFALDPGGGGDPSVLAKRIGHTITFEDLGEYRQCEDRKATSEHVSDIVREQNGASIVVDSFGIGADHSTHLAGMLADTDINVLSLNTGDTTKTFDPEQYVNPRVELAAEARRLMAAGLLSLPNNERLRGQLRAIRGKPHPSGKVALESKDNFKARYGSSCDELDAALMTLYDGTFDIMVA